MGSSDDSTQLPDVGDRRETLFQGAVSPPPRPSLLSSPAQPAAGSPSTAAPDQDAGAPPPEISTAQLTRYENSVYRGEFTRISDLFCNGAHPAHAIRLLAALDSTDMVGIGAMDLPDDLRQKFTFLRRDAIRIMADDPAPQRGGEPHVPSSHTASGAGPPTASAKGPDLNLT